MSRGADDGPTPAVESGNAGTLDTHGSGWFIGFSDWARSASGLRHMPADALAQGLCVKWFWHPAGDPNGERKPLSEARTMSILVGPPSDFRIEVSSHPDFPPNATRVIHLRETGDFAAWGPGPAPPRLRASAGRHPDAAMASGDWVSTAQAHNQKGLVGASD